MNITPPVKGTGSPEDPYQISNLGNLRWIAQAALEDKTSGKHYRQTCDIDANASSALNGGAGMEPIGTKIGDEIGQGFHTFEGVFDGGGFIIRNLTINRPREPFVGLFGIINEKGRVANVHLARCLVFGSAHVGGLAGVNRGTIENCCVRGTAAAVVGFVGLLLGANNDNATVRRCCVIGDAGGKDSQYVGGLVGQNAGALENCEASTDAFGSKTVGGLIGENGGRVHMCRAVGKVVGGKSVGGLVGYCGITQGALVSDCYSSGNVAGGAYVGALMGGAGEQAAIRNCYASGTLQCQDSHYCEGLLGANSLGYLAIEHDGPAGIKSCYCDYIGGATHSPRNLKSRATFVGWDFDRIWSIREGEGYPRLRDCGVDQRLAAIVEWDIGLEAQADARAAQEAGEQKKQQEEAQQRERQRAEEERRAKAELERKKQEEAQQRERQRVEKERQARELEARTQEQRRAAGKCVLCGKSLSFFQRLSRSEKHPQCSSDAPD